MKEEWTNPSNRTKSTTTPRMKPTSPIKIWTPSERWFLIVLKISRTILRPLAAIISKFSTNTSKGPFRANLELHRTLIVNRGFKNSWGRINCPPLASIIFPLCKTTTFRNETLQEMWTILWHRKEFKEDMESMTVDWGLLIKILADFKAEIRVKLRWKLGQQEWGHTVKATGKESRKDPHSCSWQVIWICNLWQDQNLSKINMQDPMITERISKKLWEGRWFNDIGNFKNQFLRIRSKIRFHT